MPPPTHRRRGPAEEGLSPEAQRMLGYLCVGGLALLAVVKVLRMLFFSMPLVAVLLFLTKPSPENFPAFLSMVDKKREQYEGQKKSGDNWLLSAISKGIQKTAEILVPPSNFWLYIDLGLLVVAKKKRPSTISSGKKYAIGALNTWLMIDPAVYGPDSIPVRLLDHFNAFLTDDKWHRFADMPSSSSSNTTRALGNLDVDPTKWLEHFLVQTVPSSSGSGSSGGRRSSSSSNPPSPAGARQQYMEKAQSLAESGRFEQAGRVLEEFLTQAKAAIRGGLEEVIELWLVCAAFYEAGSSFMAYQKCLRQAAEVCINAENWSKAAELFETAAMAWISKATDGDPNSDKYKIIATPKSASLLVNSATCVILCGDTVKARRIVEVAERRYPEIRETPEDEFLNEVLEACDRLDAGAIQTARNRYSRRAEAGVQEAWVDQAFQRVIKRIDAGNLR